MAVVEHDDHADQTIELGNWKAVVSFDTHKPKPAELQKENSSALGKLMVVKLGNNFFMVTGTDCHVTFKPLGGNVEKAWQYLKVEENRYVKGIFKSARILTEMKQILEGRVLAMCQLYYKLAWQLDNPDKVT